MKQKFQHGRNAARKCLQLAVRMSIDMCDSVGIITV